MEREINLETIDGMLEKILLVIFEWRLPWPLLLWKEMSQLKKYIMNLKMAALSTQHALYHMFVTCWRKEKWFVTEWTPVEVMFFFTNSLNASAEDSNVLLRSAFHDPLPGQWKCSFCWFCSRNEIPPGRWENLEEGVSENRRGLTWGHKYTDRMLCPQLIQIVLNWKCD